MVNPSLTTTPQPPDDRSPHHLILHQTSQHWAHEVALCGGLRLVLISNHSPKEPNTTLWFPAHPHRHRTFAIGRAGIGGVDSNSSYIEPVTVTGKVVSRKHLHLRIHQDGLSVQIKDIGSSHGTRIESSSTTTTSSSSSSWPLAQQCLPNQWYTLTTGDQIHIGKNVNRSGVHFTPLHYQVKVIHKPIPSHLTLAQQHSKTSPAITSSSGRVIRLTEEDLIGGGEEQAPSTSSNKSPETGLSTPSISASQSALNVPDQLVSDAILFDDDDDEGDEDYEGGFSSIEPDYDEEDVEPLHSTKGKHVDIFESATQDIDCDWNPSSDGDEAGVEIDDASESEDDPDACAADDDDDDDDSLQIDGAEVRNVFFGTERGERQMAVPGPLLRYRYCDIDDRLDADRDEKDEQNAPSIDSDTQGDDDTDSTVVQPEKQQAAGSHNHKDEDEDKEAHPRVIRDVAIPPTAANYLLGLVPEYQPSRVVIKRSFEAEDEEGGHDDEEVILEERGQDKGKTEMVQSSVNATAGASTLPVATTSVEKGQAGEEEAVDAIEDTTTMTTVSTTTIVACGVHAAGVKRSVDDVDPDTDGPQECTLAERMPTIASGEDVSCVESDSSRTLATDTDIVVETTLPVDGSSPMIEAAAAAALPAGLARLRAYKRRRISIPMPTMPSVKLPAMRLPISMPSVGIDGQRVKHVAAGMVMGAIGTFLGLAAVGAAIVERE